MSDPASWDLLDEDCSDISDWVDADYDTGVSEVDPAGQFRLDTNLGASGNASAARTRDIGSYPDKVTFEIKLYHDSIGTSANVDRMQFSFYNANERFIAFFCSDGLFIRDTDSGDTEVGTNLVKEGASKEWQTWRFLIDFSGATGNGTCDVYLKDSIHNWELVGNDVPCSDEITTEPDGYTRLLQFGWTTNNMVSHIDYVRAATDLYIPETEPHLFDGKIIITANCAIDPLDGKVRIKDAAIDLLDGKVHIEERVTKLLDGKLRIKSNTVDLLDGKVQVKDVDTDLLDGKVCIEGIGYNYLDGKVWVKELITGDVKLPFLEMQGNTGAVGNTKLPLLEVLGEASPGINAQGSATLPALKALGYAGARCDYDLPSLEVLGTAVVGIVASGEVTLPVLSIESQAFTDAIVEGDVELPMLRVRGTSIGGAICNGKITLPSLEVRATGKVGVVCAGEVTLPLLVIEGEGIHIPVGNGEVVLPLIQVYATANVLVDPRDGCHILEYARWR